jgi:hypothetical protein
MNRKKYRNRAFVAVRYRPRKGNEKMFFPPSPLRSKLVIMTYDLTDLNARVSYIRFKRYDVTVPNALGFHISRTNEEERGKRNFYFVRTSNVFRSRQTVMIFESQLVPFRGDCGGRITFVHSNVPIVVGVPLTRSRRHTSSRQSETFRTK